MIKKIKQTKKKEQPLLEIIKAFIEISNSLQPVLHLQEQLRATDRAEVSEGNKGPAGILLGFYRTLLAVRKI